MIEARMLSSRRPTDPTIEVPTLSFRRLSEAKKEESAVASLNVCPTAAPSDSRFLRANSARSE